MALRVIGAGVGRTGTMSLKIALSRLLGGPCYHMVEVFERPQDALRWRDAALGKMPDWSAMLADYRAAVDWPASAFWSELAAEFPDAIILLSTRDAEEWWASAESTIFAKDLGGQQPPEWREMIDAMVTHRFTPDRHDRAAAIAAYNRHNAHVRATVPRDRLVDWTVADGWGPICRALGVDEPSDPFPRANTREDWHARRAARSSS